MDPHGPGYRRILIRPQMVRDLASVSATVETVRGAVTSTWTHSPGKITLEVTVPVNSEAQVVIPKEIEMGDVVVREGDRVVWDKGRFVPGAPGVKSAVAGAEAVSFFGPTKEAISFEVGSGQYLFKLSKD